jgi:hypothetical protein
MLIVTQSSTKAFISDANHITPSSLLPLIRKYESSNNSFIGNRQKPKRKKEKKKRKKDRKKERKSIPVERRDTDRVPGSQVGRGGAEDEGKVALQQR